ncbi:DUF1365 domain-containing protein [Gynuella sunshinyii]|uniref:DUF1365 domain-containing protein n=1 Tax=Gynuella sunshinyii YC6258 TaxID=1445510 RepID=A0A0C5VL36_9GAMM|nr:DUF1365 domain-containing protein [Gynuella sunshinyii]AJQ95026.1 hypothetical protein YC6258_02988 [Gynuella sunshinyii YC6258]
MDMMTPQLLEATVGHRRLFPTENQFEYRIYYLVLPVSKLAGQTNINGLAIDCFAPLSFYHRDHGRHQDRENLEDWANDILRAYELDRFITDITLITLPRVMGYTFNPVSFWICQDSNGQIRAVLNEVNNTFGESHTYLCAHEDNRPIKGSDWISAEKLFHVSPFLQRSGEYCFQFNISDHQLSIRINYRDADGKNQLLTSLAGNLMPMNRSNLHRMFWRYPLITAKAITLIHWQAIKLALKKIGFFSRPEQLPETLSSSKNLHRKPIDS